MAFLSFQNEIRFRLSLEVESGLDSLYPFSIFGSRSPTIHTELLDVHFKIFPACFGSLTAKTTSCFFEPSSAPV
jgi:hypothetical protein